MNHYPINVITRRKYRVKVSVKGDVFNLDNQPAKLHMGSKAMLEIPLLQQNWNLEGEDWQRLWAGYPITRGEFSLMVDRVTFLRALVHFECLDDKEFYSFLTWANEQSRNPEGDWQLLVHPYGTYEWWMVLLNLVRNQKMIESLEFDETKPMDMVAI